MDDQAHRLIVLWKSARDKYRSFFSVLNEVRREIGDDALSVYCREQLRISLSIILETSKLLSKTDAEIAKEELAFAMRAERAKRAAEREAQENERLKREEGKEARRRAKEFADAEHKRKLAEAEDAKHKAERNKAKRQKDRDDPKRHSPEYYAGAYGRTLKQRSADEDESKADMKEAKGFHRMLARSDANWIEASIGLAQVLYRQRQRHGTNNNSFGQWYKESELPYGPEDRAALIEFGGMDVKRLRQIFENRDTNSYQHILRRNKPHLSVVG